MEEIQLLAPSPSPRHGTPANPSAPLRSSDGQQLPIVPKPEAPSTAQQRPGRQQKPVRGPKLPSKSMKYFEHVLNVTWLPEVTSLILAIMALVATVIILVTRKDKPQPEWPSLLNINALNAIFSTTLKAAILFTVSECISEMKWGWFAAPQPVSDFDRFDSASRGPWGAFLLLLKRPGSIATALGSLVTILSLAADPFTQQVLRFNNCLLPIEEASATIARTNNYTSGAFGRAVGQPSASVAMSAALYQGLLDPPPNASTIISTYCQSGNCTFPHAIDTAYTSLAMCVSVEDITRTVSGNDSSDEDSSYETYNYTLPSGIFLPGTRALTTSVIPPDPSDATRPLLNIEALMINSDCNQGNGKCTATPFAIRVTLSPCIHTYTNISYSNARFSETISSTTNLPYIPNLRYFSLAGAYPALPSIDCAALLTRSEFKPEAVHTLPSGVRYHGFSPYVADDANTLYCDPGCVYDFSYGPTMGIENAFGQNFFGTLASPLNITIPRGLTSQPFGDSWLLRLYAEGRADISSAERYFQGLAMTMTAAIRDGGDAIGSEPARGTVMANQTCVGVDWAWLALPILLIVLTAVFLVITILTSRRSRHLQGRGGRGREEGGRKAWKSSTLPFLWCGISDEIRDRHDAFNEVEEMKKTSDGLRVQLVRQDGVGHSKPVGNEKRRWVLKEE